MKIYAIRVPGFDWDVPVVIDPACEHRGVVRFEGFHNRPVIYLREWDARVFFHEALHVLIAAWRHQHQQDTPPVLTIGTREEEAFVRHLTALYDVTSGNEDRCSQCGEWFPKPVDLHHDEQECQAARGSLLVQRHDWLLDTVRKISNGVADPMQTAWDAVKRDHRLKEGDDAA